MSTLTLSPPSDSQLAYIADLRLERGCVPPEAVCSMQEASEIIRAILDSTYDARRYRVPFTYDDDLPFI